MDLNPYCPKEIILKPGPLFSDTQAIKDRAMGFLGEVMQASSAKLLCRVCGFPQCTCRRCTERSKVLDQKWSLATRCTGTHTCWLGGSLKSRIPKAGPKESEEQLALRQQAWAKLGVATLPAWVSAKANNRDVSGYAFS